MDGCTSSSSSSSAACTVRFASHCAFIPAPCKKSKAVPTPSRSASPAPATASAPPGSPKPKSRVTTKAVSIPLRKISLKLPLPLVEFNSVSPAMYSPTLSGPATPCPESPGDGCLAPPPVPSKSALPAKSCLRVPRPTPAKKRPTTPRRASMPLPFAPMQLVQEVKPVPGRTLGEIEVIPVKCTLLPLAPRRKPRLAGILRRGPREAKEDPEELEMRALRAHELKACCAKCASACTASALQAEQWTFGARRAWAAYTFGEHFAHAGALPGLRFSVDEVDLRRRRSQEIPREGEAAITAIAAIDARIRTSFARNVRGSSSTSSADSLLSYHSTDSLVVWDQRHARRRPCSPPTCLSPAISDASSPAPSPALSLASMASAFSPSGDASPRPCPQSIARRCPAVQEDDDELFPLPARKCSPCSPAARPSPKRRASAVCAMDRVLDMSVWKEKGGELVADREAQTWELVDVKELVEAEELVKVEELVEVEDSVTHTTEPADDAEQCIQPSLTRKTTDRRRSASLALSLPQGPKPTHRRSSSISIGVISVQVPPSPSICGPPSPSRYAPPSPSGREPSSPSRYGPSSPSACEPPSPSKYESDALPPVSPAISSCPVTPVSCHPPPTRPTPKSARRGSFLSSKRWKAALSGQV
ncbi:hypothetical protein BD626DRAFT_487944 [Schizophyllum amplum]|uniref:Uncharacterized protein n=1 Tax=Schizophyllum amplum TaxID=97359 RepID=A0A550CK94_9AGAR|nr:hypothetical protein BD626DRAFT_487944 [Auriculariopsis ampla]